ncbi:MAG: alpha/beta hydrolase [Maribacter sp.]|uniref:alpha/beta hydrolase n=1 Tax=Maribacter sp. TaxID=1897614 RepID=UPI0032996178
MLQVDLKKIAGFILFFLLVVGGSHGQDAARYEVKEHRNLSYLKDFSLEIDTLQRLNLALPKAEDNFPLLVWIGGGAWSYVDRNVEMDLARKFAQEGIGFASIGHRLSPAKWRDSTLSSGVRHPAHVKDIASSVKWLFDNASKYGYDKEKIFVGGYSSGAHLAALLCLDDSYLNEKGLSTSNIRGVIPISGTYDIVNYHEVFRTGERPELAELHVQAVFGDTKEDFIKASPTSYLQNLGVPMLLISDNALDRYTRLFEKRLKETDFDNYSIIYVSELNHGQLWNNLSFDDFSTYRVAIIEFIKAKSGKTP